MVLLMRTTPWLATLLVFGGCLAPLPKAIPTIGDNGLQKVLVETFGLE